MPDKKAILDKCEKYLRKKKGFSFRVCKLLKDGEFFDILSSQDLAHAINEGAGNKIKINELSSLMPPLQKDDIIKVIVKGSGSKKRKFWFPGWIDKKHAEQKVVSPSSVEDVFFFTGNHNWTDPNKNFPRVIEQLEGDLSIVDPFYGSGTFYVLQKFGDKRKIRFLTCKLGSEDEAKKIEFGHHFKRFKKEFKNIEMRKYEKFYELHDRYIVADNGLVIVGHGIKDLAGKESFVVFLPKKLVIGFLPVLKKCFEERWKKSINLT